MTPNLSFMFFVCSLYKCFSFKYFEAMLLHTQKVCDYCTFLLHCIHQYKNYYFGVHFHVYLEFYSICHLANSSWGIVLLFFYFKTLFFILRMSFVNHTYLEFILLVFLPYLSLPDFQHGYLTTFIFVVIPNILDAFWPSDLCFLLTTISLFFKSLSFYLLNFFVSIFSFNSLITTGTICALLSATFKTYDTFTYIFLPLLETISITILFLQ